MFYIGKVATKRSMTISLFLDILMKHPLNYRPTSFKDLRSRNNLSVFDVDLLYTIEFPILVKLDSGFDIYVLFFTLIVRMIRI